MCERDYLKITLLHSTVVALSTMIVVLPVVAFVYLCFVALHLIPPVDGQREQALPVDVDGHAIRHELKDG